MGTGSTMVMRSTMGIEFTIGYGAQHGNVVHQGCGVYNAKKKEENDSCRGLPLKPQAKIEHKKKLIRKLSLQKSKSGEIFIPSMNDPPLSLSLSP